MIRNVPAGGTKPSGIRYGISIVQAPVQASADIRIAQVQFLNRDTRPGGVPIGHGHPFRDPTRGIFRHGLRYRRAIRIDAGAQVLGKPAVIPDLHHVIGVAVHRGRRTIGVHRRGASAVIRRGFGIVFDESGVGAAQDVFIPEAPNGEAIPQIQAPTRYAISIRFHIPPDSCPFEERGTPPGSELTRQFKAT